MQEPSSMGEPEPQEKKLTGVGSITITVDFDKAGETRIMTNVPDTYVLLQMVISAAHAIMTEKKTAIPMSPVQ